MGPHSQRFGGNEVDMLGSADKLDLAIIAGVSGSCF